MGIARLSISDLPEPERMAISRTVPSRVGGKEQTPVGGVRGQCSAEGY